MEQPQTLTTCMSCHEQTPLPAKEAPWGTSLICIHCHAPLIRPADPEQPLATSPDRLNIIFGLMDRGLDHPRCPHCNKINYAVIFPAKGMSLPWYAVAEPEHPSGSRITVSCIHCKKEFFIEWDQIVLEESPRLKIKIKETSFGQHGWQPRPDIHAVSPDSRHFAYFKADNDKWCVIADGIKGKTYDGLIIGSLTYSPDGQHLAYAAVLGDKRFVVIDGREEKGYDGIGNLVFSPDSLTLAYSAQGANGWAIVVDGVEGRYYEGVSAGFLFRPGSHDVVYIGIRGKEWFTVLDGVEGKAYEGISELSFSPDGNVLAYIARRGQEKFVVVNGKEGHSYDGAAGFWFQPGTNNIAYMAQRGNKWLVVMDTIESEVYDGLGNQCFAFSSDGRHYAFSARNQQKWVVVLDGWKGPGYDGVGIPLFSPDGNNYAYIAARAGWHYAVLDGVETCKQKMISSLVFSPDGKHLACTAFDGSHCLLIVDEEIVAKYAGFLRGASVVFDSSGSFHTIAVSKDGLLLVECDILSG